MTVIKDFKKHNKNIFWSIVNQILIIAGTLIVSILAVRLKGKDFFGDFTFLTSLFGLLFFVAASGTREIIIREVALNKEDVFFSGTKYSFIWSFLGSLFLLIIGFWLKEYKSSQIGTTIMWSALIFPFYTSFQTWMSWYKGKKQYFILAILNAIKLILQISGVVFLMINNYSIMLVVLFFLGIEGVYNLIVCVWIVKKYTQTNQKIFTWKKQSWVLSLMDLSVQIFGKADAVIMGLFFSSTTLAIYAIVMKVIEGFSQIIYSAIQGILPSFYKKENLKIQYFYQYFWWSFVIVIILLPIIKYPIEFLYGGEVNEAVRYTQVYLFSLPFFFLAKISNYFLIKYNLDKDIITNKLLAIGLVLVLYLILIPKYNIMGGIVASYVFFIIQFVLNRNSLKKLKN